MSYTVFDIEADGFNPTKIYCLSAWIDGNIYTITDYDDMRRYFKSFDTYIGHYITLYDIPVVERLLGIKVTGSLIDTLPLSWYLFPTRNKHGLESWGENFGIPKPTITDWFNLTVEEYSHRCEEDVKINVKLWIEINKYLKKLYPNGEDYQRFLQYLQFKMDTVREQEEEGWKLDVEKARSALSVLEKLEKERFDQLVEVMPKVPVRVKRARPKVMTTKDGRPSKNALGWFRLMAELGLPQGNEEPVEIITGYEEPTPSSTQLKKWLFTLGWRPQTFKTNDKGDEVPQINLPHGAGLCDSVKELYEIEPRLEVLDGYFVIRHRIGVLSGFLRDVGSDGYLRAGVSGLTNTLRFKHSTVVNLPKVDKAYAEAIRGSLTCPSGFILCGSDMASLEDRLKQHYIFPLDPDYVNTMLEPGFDPHLDLAVRGGMLTQEQADGYKQGRTEHKGIRNAAKTTNYACQYGAGAGKIAKATGLDLNRARQFHETYWKRNWAVKAVAEAQNVFNVGDDMWLKNPLNGFYYSLRSMKDRFSTLVQGTASYVFDVWLGLLRQSGLRVTAQFHDEFVSKIREGDEEVTRKIINQAIADVNSLLKLNREMGAEIQFGHFYSDIH